MGFYINEEIETKLHFKEIIEITVAMNHYIDLYKDRMEDEQKTRMLSIINRLGREMYDHPDNDKPNSH